MKTGFLVTARMKSTRLPKKLTLKINNREIIAWLIDRLKQSKILNEIVIATSPHPQDGALCEIAHRENVKFFKGSEDDVLERLFMAAKKFELDYIINITGDCPLVSFDFIDQVLALYRKSHADLVTTFKLPHGLYLYGIKVSALEKVLKIKNEVDTEIWGSYFTETGLFKVEDLDIPIEYQRENYRLTLDYPEDFEFFKAVFNGLGEETYRKSTKEIIEFLDKHPEIVEINAHCEGLYKKRYEQQRKLTLK
ncbi:MAG: cytidylyltransferase domain-containing protein [Candidatus Hodarchaeales archaeon]|jgi:spore coat polysaccharide biosynthesis protein SpsF